MERNLSPEEGDHYLCALLACNRHLTCSKAVSPSAVSRLDQIASLLVFCCSSALVVYTDIDSHDLLSRLLDGVEGCGRVPRPRRIAVASMLAPDDVLAKQRLLLLTPSCSAFVVSNPSRKLSNSSVNTKGLRSYYLAGDAGWEYNLL